MDKKKAYYSVSYSWITWIFRKDDAAENIELSMKKSMKMWKIQLIANNERLGKVWFIREIFEDYSLIPILFLITMILLTDILKKAGDEY